MKKSTSELKPPSRPEINGEKTRFLSLSELQSKEAPFEAEEPKTQKTKFYAALAAVLALGVTTATIVVKKKGPSDAVVRDEEPMEHHSRQASRLRNENPGQGTTSESSAPSYFQPNPSYQDGQSYSQNMGSYPQDEADRMPAYSEYDNTEVIEAEPIAPMEDSMQSQPPPEEYYE